MSIVAKTLMSAAAVFVGAWLACVAAVFIKALRRGALLQGGNVNLGWPQRLVLAVSALPLIFVIATATLVNCLTFLVGFGWSHLRRRRWPHMRRGEVKGATVRADTASNGRVSRGRPFGGRWHAPVKLARWTR